MVRVLTARCAETFERLGYQVRAAQETVDGHTHIYFSAKRGRFNRLGYILTHLAIIVICLGGLMDSELSIRAQVWFFGKQPLTLPALQVPESATLKPDTLSYRGASAFPRDKRSTMSHFTPMPIMCWCKTYRLTSPSIASLWIITVRACPNALPLKSP